jgi:anthranilate synthase component 2
MPEQSKIFTESTGACTGGRIMILLVDNYDSFSYNLYQLIGEIEPNIKVIRNDEMTVDQIKELNPDRIILSPGPGRPENAGIIIEAVKTLGQTIPILGVCLGHQAICAAFGATVTYAKKLMHGKQSNVRFDADCLLFKGCPEVAPVARYHSLAADADTIPEYLKITALTTEGEVMAAQHKDYPIYGVQFHPESIMTPDGKQMLRNFIKEI